MFLTPDRLETPVGVARLVREGPQRGALLVLGHGAGGGIEAPDLLAARDAALDVGLGTVRVEQPWRVRGRRVAESHARLDVAWRTVLTALSSQAPAPAGALVVGGRSSGARVACRTAAEVGASAVLALGFPLRPPAHPERSRLPELLLPDVPRLVVQGARDAFGCPDPGPRLEVHRVRGADHAFSVRRRDGRTAAEVAEEVRAVVARWLRDVVSAGPGDTQTLT